MVWLVVEAGNEVGVAVMEKVVVAPGAMIRDPLERLAEASPVALAPMENELVLQAELSRLTTVNV